MDYAQRTRLSNQLNLVIKRKLKKDGLVIDSQCDGMMHRFVNFGVERLLLANAATQPDRVNMAEESVERFIDCMKKHAERNGTHPGIDEKTFEAAKRESCPIWPFC